MKFEFSLTTHSHPNHLTVRYRFSLINSILHGRPICYVYTLFTLLILESEPGCEKMTTFMKGFELSWPNGDLKYDVTCGMGDGTFLDAVGIKSLGDDAKHPISTSYRSNDGSNYCKMTCKPGTMLHVPSKFDQSLRLQTQQKVRVELLTQLNFQVEIDTHFNKLD